MGESGLADGVQAKDWDWAAGCLGDGVSGSGKGWERMGDVGGVADDDGRAGGDTVVGERADTGDLAVGDGATGENGDAVTGEKGAGDVSAGDAALGDTTTAGEPATAGGELAADCSWGGGD